MSIEKIAERLMQCATEFAIASTSALEQQRPDQYKALEPLLVLAGASLHIVADIQPNAKVSAFLRIDGQSYELAHVDLRIDLKT